MRVFFGPVVPMSRAMDRVANALRRHAPPWVESVRRPPDADLEIVHAIGLDAVSYVAEVAKAGRRRAVIQYCLNGSPGDWWRPLWDPALVVWSYYEFARGLPNGYLAPLGIDDAFLLDRNPEQRPIGVVTSGYVNGPGAEAIEEVVRAANTVGLSHVHIGPRPVGMTDGLPMKCLRDISDAELSLIYSGAQWVSGLRRIEGFEMPCIEGLSQGARPIVFRRPDMFWYADVAHFVPEDDTLYDSLVTLFSIPAVPLGDATIARIRNRFDWRHIVMGFWKKLEERL